MTKVRIRVLSPVLNPSGKYLKPGKYSAELSRNGTLSICQMIKSTGNKWRYILKPDQFEFIDAPDELVNYWKARMELVKAQGEYEAAWHEYQAISS